MGLVCHSVKGILFVGSIGTQYCAHSGLKVPYRGFCHINDTRYSLEIRYGERAGGVEYLCRIEDVGAAEYPVRSCWGGDITESILQQIKRRAMLSPLIKRRCASTAAGGETELCETPATDMHACTVPLLGRHPKRCLEDGGMLKLFKAHPLKARGFFIPRRRCRLRGKRACEMQCGMPC